MSLGDLKVAIVHDELTRRGGAEVVLEELVRIMPQANVYTLFAGQPRMIVDGREVRVKTSFLQSFPVWFRRHPSRLLALLPAAAEQFDLSSYDLVISSSSGFAKAVVTRVSVPHLCYCHTPTRYLWSDTRNALKSTPPILRWPGSVLLHYLRLADFAAAQRVTAFVANSKFTQMKIKSYYRRRSEVVYPPVDTAYFTPRRTNIGQGYFLLVGRLTKSKNFHQAISVCEKLKLKLIVVGVGREFSRLRKLAGLHTSFTGQVSPERLRELLRGARALLQPGEEDFGLAAAEALACGTPVIALGRGGAREVIDHQTTGILYDEPREEILAEAMRQFLIESDGWPPEKLQQSVLKFASHRFASGIEALIWRIMKAGEVRIDT